ncbi:hypothetical protein [Frankia sp. R43]|uniref:hypothetical protein n=1 Tax=Frankia sp. R43 TaxID=269536 RepID=UPI0006CA55D3|nr:hypothetical protein [Frankia sp. R43]
MNQPPAHPRTDDATPTTAHTSAAPQSPDGRDQLGPVEAIALHTGDLYRDTDPERRARDHARHGTDLWIVLDPLDLTALDRDEEPLLHVRAAGGPHRASWQFFGPEDTVDRVGVLQHESSGRVGRGYELTWVYRMPQHTVRVRVFRVHDRYEDHQHTSSATAQILTPTGWAELLTHPADHWPPGGGYVLDEASLLPLAGRLIADTHRVLTPLTPPAPRDPVGDVGPVSASGGDRAERRPARAARVLRRIPRAR